MQGLRVPLPGRYVSEIAVMREMGWSWPELMAAPADLVEQLLEERAARSHWEGEKAKIDASKAKARPRGRRG